MSPNLSATTCNPGNRTRLSYVELEFLRPIRSTKFTGQRRKPRTLLTAEWSPTRSRQKARELTLTENRLRHRSGGRPFDLRHAAVWLWLNAGVPAPQVAEWAGHSVAVLLKIYAKCIDGEDEIARRRIEAALGTPVLPLAA